MQTLKGATPRERQVEFEVGARPVPVTLLPTEDDTDDPRASLGGTPGARPAGGFLRCRLTGAHDAPPTSDAR
ncbi:MAG TPA: hypothetical protein VFS67_25790 [Polyangiaceae bacterium]|nr:hypothetical protein [Polyangiaceae bacterium]